MPHYLGADFHLGDRSITRYREEFKFVKQHDEFIADTVLCHLRSVDLLTMVGDCLVGRSSLELIKKFPCRKRLIAGNHDFEKGIRFSDLVGVVDEVHSSYKWRSRFNIVHIPPHADHLRNKIIIHGHLHEVIIPDPRYINVSLEATGFRLIQAEEIIQGSYRSYRVPESNNHVEQISRAET